MEGKVICYFFVPDSRLPDFLDYLRFLNLPYDVDLSRREHEGIPCRAVYVTEELDPGVEDDLRVLVTGMWGIDFGQEGMVDCWSLLPGWKKWRSAHVVQDD